MTLTTKDLDAIDARAKAEDDETTLALIALARIELRRGQRTGAAPDLDREFAPSTLPLADQIREHAAEIYSCGSDYSRDALFNIARQLEAGPQPDAAPEPVDRTCPVCGGDCSDANPPVIFCPRRDTPRQVDIQKLDDRSFIEWASSRMDYGADDHSKKVAERLISIARLVPHLRYEFDEARRSYCKAATERDAVRAAPPAPVPAGEVADWRDDPSADERWNAGCDYAMTQLCKVFDVDPQAVNWDAATETLDGDVQAVIWNIIRARLGEDWSITAARACVEAVNAQALGSCRDKQFYEARETIRAAGDVAWRVSNYLLGRFIEGSVYAAEGDKRDGFLDLRDARTALAARDARIAALESEVASLKGVTL